MAAVTVALRASGLDYGDTILTIMQDVAPQVGLTDDVAVVMSSTDPTLVQLRAFSLTEGNILARAHQWRNLKVQATITGDATSEYWDLPIDFDRQMAGDLIWEQSSPYRPIEGPIDDETFNAMKASNITPPFPIWRYFGDKMQIWPVLGTSDICQFEYQSRYWIVATDDITRKRRWTLDTDYSLIPAELITLGLIWRWKRAKGLDYAEEFNTYQMELQKAMRADAGYKTLTARESWSETIDRRKNAYTVTP